VKEAKHQGLIFANEAHLNELHSTNQLYKYSTNKGIMID